MSLDAPPPKFSPAAGFVFDVDGTLVREGKVLPGAQAVFDTLHEIGLGVAIASNATWRSSEQLADFLDTLGLRPDAGATITVLDLVPESLTRLPAARRAIVLGHVPLIEAVAATGIEVVSQGPADTVVVGRLRASDWDRLDTVVHSLFQGAAYIATSEDAIAVAGDGTIGAGAGAAVAALERVTGRRPDQLIGKPSPQMIIKAAGLLGVSLDSIVMVGDSPWSDIAAGCAAGAATVLVETGVAALERRARHHWTPPVATHTMRSLVELERALERDSPIRIWRGGSSAP